MATSNPNSTLLLTTPNPNFTRTRTRTRTLILTLTLTLIKASGGFFWEVYKPTADGEATATATAQAICNAVLPGNARCSGKFPSLPPSPAFGRTNNLVESVVE